MFLASQNLWWILTCSWWSFCCDCNPLQESQVDGIDVWDDKNVFLNCQTYYTVVKIIFFSLTRVGSRCFWASQNLWWILTCSWWSFCCDCNPLQESQIDGIDVWDDKNVLLNCQTYYTVAKIIFFSLTRVGSRCFWASQNLWWILTCSWWSFCCDWNPLLESQVDGIDVWDDKNVLLNCQPYYIVVKNHFLQFNNSWK